MHKYLIVGGTPFSGYTGTVTYTSLRVVGKANTVQEVETIVENQYDNCGGLFLVIDSETGEPADNVPFGK